MRWQASTLLVGTIVVLVTPAASVTWQIKRDGSVVSEARDVLADKGPAGAGVEPAFTGAQVLLSESQGTMASNDQPPEPKEALVFQAENVSNASNTSSLTPTPSPAPEATAVPTPQPTKPPKPAPTKVPVPGNKTKTLKPMTPRPTPKPKAKNMTNEAMWKAFNETKKKKAKPSPSGQPLPPDDEMEYELVTVSATMTEPVEAGAKRLDIGGAASMGFEAGNPITLNPGGDNEETNTVVGFGSILLGSPLMFKHFPGEKIEQVKKVFKKGANATANATASPTNTKEPGLEGDKKADDKSVQEKDQQEQQGDQDGTGGGGGGAGGGSGGAGQKEGMPPQVTATLMIFAGAIVFAYLGAVTANCMFGKRGMSAMVPMGGNK